MDPKVSTVPIYENTKFPTSAVIQDLEGKMVVQQELLLAELLWKETTRKIHIWLVNGSYLIGLGLDIYIAI